MSTTTKELPVAGSIADISAGSESGGAPGSRRTDAVGAEIPVVVNASRYSASTKGASKQLPAVHEETRTVIVFPQGAVVRLSASMTVGELVVLTNRQTGADALCRVVNVKAQPGIQNYVNLEFTQRTPGFWGECIQTDRSEAPAPMVSMPSAQASPSQSVSPSQVATEPISAPMGFRPPAPSDSSLASSAASNQRPSKSGAAVSSPSPLEASIGISQPDAGQSWTRPARAEEAPSGTKKILMIAAAAVVLVGIGVAGGMFMLHQSKPSASGNQPQSVQSVAVQPSAASPVDSPVAPSSETPAVSAPSASPAPAAPSIQPAEVKSASQAPKVVSPAPQQVAHRPNVDAKIAAPIVKGSAKVAAVDAPVLAASGLVGSSLNAGVLGSSANSSLAAPPPAALAKGGQIQPPKLISSPSAIYPTQARVARIQGDVVVDALVDSTGNVTTVKAISGPAPLQQAAMDAIRNWKYEPARLNGKPIEIHTRVSLSFHLQ